MMLTLRDHCVDYSDQNDAPRFGKIKSILTFGFSLHRNVEIHHIQKLTALTF